MPRVQPFFGRKKTKDAGALFLMYTEVRELTKRNGGGRGCVCGGGGGGGGRQTDEGGTGKADRLAGSQAGTKRQRDRGNRVRHTQRFIKTE